MRWVDASKRWALRADVRAVGQVAATILLAIGIQSAVLLYFQAEESVEEASRRLQEITRVLESEPAVDGSRSALFTELVHESRRHRIGIRLLGADGSPSRAWGDWPESGESVLTRSVPEQTRALLLAIASGAHIHFVRPATLPSGERAEVAISLRTYGLETAEFAGLLAALWLASSSIALLAAWLAIRFAFRPLARATMLLPGSPAQLPTLRMPTRGTSDPVDLHAEAVNRTLDALSAAFARLRAFTRDVSHELRTPLNRIANVAEVAQRSGEPDQIAEALESARQSVEELSRVTRTMLFLAELEDGRIAQTLSRIDGDAHLARTCALYQPLFERAGKGFDLGSQLGALETDAALLDRALVNLLENALSHTAPGASVRVSGQRDGSYAEIAVDDSGPGISPAAAASIFDRGGAVASPSSAGRVGLGLPLVAAIARVLGGSIALQRSPLGGARFEVRVPLR